MKNHTRNHVNVSALHLYTRQKISDIICVFELIHFRDMEALLCTYMHLHTDTQIYQVRKTKFNVKNKVRSVNSSHIKALMEDFEEV